MPRQTERPAAERHARKIGVALAKGRTPPSSRELDAFAQDGGAVFETLEGLVAHLAAGDGEDSPLVYGYDYLLRSQLQSLRFQQDRGYDVAIGMLENFQRAVAGHTTAGRLRGTALSLVAVALHQAGIVISADLTAAIEDTLDDTTEDVPGTADPGILTGLIESIVELCEGNAFLVASSLMETAHGMPLELRTSMAAILTVSQSAAAREAAVLLLLDPEPAIRSAAAAALESQPASVSPRSMRRLIAMRNWRPPAERAEIDKIVRAARAHGIDCAGWEPGGAEEILSSGLDGSGAQTSMVVSPAGRRKRLSSILCKNGLQDAWCGPPEGKSQFRMMLAEATEEVDLRRVSRAYLDRVICHGIQVALDAGACPPAGLLEIAEALGGADWQPQRLEWRAVLGELLVALPAERRTPAAVAATLAASDDLVLACPITDSWFEDDQEVARIVQRSGPRSTEEQAAYLLQSVIEQRREKWAELIVWTAAWLREASAAESGPEAGAWQEFAIVADAVAQGHDLGQIPLMETVAYNTAYAMEDAARSAG